MPYFLFIFFEQISYFINKKSAHGLHSPYLFHLITKTFQKKIDVQDVEALRSHFPEIPKKNARQFLQILQEKHPSKNLQIPEKLSFCFVFDDDLYYFQSPIDFQEFINKEQTFPQERIHFIQGIRTNSKILKIWRDLTEHPKFHVSIDLFQVGILVSRPHQQKQKFIL